METQVEKQVRAFVVLNPVAGRTTPDAVRSALETTFAQHGWEYDVYETKPDDDIQTHVQRALDEGCELIVAAGGDGTVSMVADCLVGSDVPLGILPAGSANVLSLELGIPGDITLAAELLIGPHTERQFDAMRMNGQHFILQIGIGLDSLMIKETDREAKRSLGRWAYMRTLVQNMFGFESQRFTIVVDGIRMRTRAAQVLIANAGTLGTKLLRWGPHIRPDDGELDLCLVKVRTLLDYPRVLWQFVTGPRPQRSNITYLRIKDSVLIACDRPLPVQADGEITGATPISVTVLPSAIRIIVPSNQPAALVDVPNAA